MTFSGFTVKIAAGAAAIAAAGILTSPAASADPTIQRFGTTERLVSANGAEVRDYTVKNLQPSGNNDGVYFSDVTVQAVQGVVTPIIGDFNARAADGTNYSAIEGNSPDGLTNQPIAPGGAANGRVYFQVDNGPAPNSVVYNNGVADELIWTG